MDEDAPRVVLAGRLGLTTPAGRATADDLPGRQPRLTLAYLVRHRATPIAHETLAQVLWPSGPPASWPAALRGLVARVRRFLRLGGLDGDALTGADGCYLLHLPPHTQVDVEDAVRAAITAEQCLGQDDERARGLAIRTLDVTGQPFLPGTSGRWVEDERDDLERARLRALRVLGRIHLDRGDTDRALRAARDAMALAPRQEEHWRLLIRALAANGERAEALRVYEHHRAALAEELGIDPSPATADLYVRLLRGH